MTTVSDNGSEGTEGGGLEVKPILCIVVSQCKSTFKEAPSRSVIHSCSSISMVSLSFKRITLARW